MCVRACVRACAGSYKEALAYHRRDLALCRTAVDPQGEAMAHQNVGICLARSNGSRGKVEHAEQGPGGGEHAEQGRGGGEHAEQGQRVGGGTCAQCRAPELT